MILQMSPVNWRFSVAKGHFETSVLSFSPLKLDFPNPGPYNHVNLCLHLERCLLSWKNCLLHTSKHLLPPHLIQLMHTFPWPRFNPRCAAHTSSTSSAYWGTSLTGVPVAPMLWVTGTVLPLLHLAFRPSHPSAHTPKTLPPEIHIDRMWWVAWSALCC